MTDLEKAAAIIEIMGLKERCDLRPECPTMSYARYCLTRAEKYLLLNDSIRVAVNIREALGHMKYSESLPQGPGIREDLSMRPIRWFAVPWATDTDEYG